MNAVRSVGVPLLPVRARTPSPSGLWTGVALCVAMMAATSWAVINGDWVDSGGALLAVAVVAVLEAALLARLEAPRYLAILAVPLFAFVAMVPFTIAGMVPDGDTSFLHLAGRYAHAMWIPVSLFATDNWTFLIALAMVLWICGYVLCWLAVSERRGGAAVFLCFFVLAINLLNAPRTDSLLFPDTLAAVIALVIVAQTNLRSLAASWRRRGVAVIPGMVSRYVRTSVILVLVVLGVALVAPPASTHDFTTSVLQSIHNGSNGGAHSHSANAVAAVGFSADTSPGGALSDANPQKMLEYSTTAASPVYLGIAADSQFQDGAWLQDVGTLSDAPDGAITIDKSSAGLGAARSTVQLTVTALASGATSSDGATSYAPWIGEPLSVSEQGAAIGVAASAQNGSPSVSLISVDRYVLGNQTFAAGTTLQITSAVSTASEDQLRNAGTAYPVAILNGYTGFPGGGEGSQLRSLATSWTTGATTPYDRAKAIEAHLRSSPFTYTLTPPDAPAGTWPIIDFLFHTHRGYCQYFAASMGALLRAEGIPARLVNGYANGTFSGVDARGLDQFTVTSDDAHTWVEAFFPGYGWIAFEPTPPSALGDYEPLQRGTAAPSPSPGSTPQPSLHATPAPRHTPSPDVTPPPPPVVTPGPPSAIVVPVALVLGLIALLLGAIVWLERPRDLPGLWRRISIVGRFFGVGRRPGDTDSDFAARIAAAIPPDTTTLLHPHGDAKIGLKPLHASVTEALSEIALIAGKARFSKEGIEAKERVRWLRAWRRIVRALPRLLWRSVVAQRDAPAAPTAESLH